jgi:hypothetical protein
LRAPRGWRTLPREMDLSYGPTYEAFRAELRRFLAGRGA